MRPVSVQCGASLVEMLVAMTVLSIGLLGIASLFLRELADSRAALLRTQAIGLVGDMMDRIRANVAGGASYDLASYGGLPALQGCEATDSSAGANCSSVQLAEDDLARWRSAVQGALPAALVGISGANVEFLGGEPARYRIAVTWQEPGQPLPFSFSSELLAEATP